MIFSKSREISMARILAGLSMRGLAQKAGLNIGTISKIESRKQSVTPKTAKSICEVLGKDLKDLFFVDWEDNKGEKE